MGKLAYDGSHRERGSCRIDTSYLWALRAGSRPHCRGKLDQHILRIVDMSWNRFFSQPVSLPSGLPARTLRDAGEFIKKLPKLERDRPEWRAAIYLLIEAAEDRLLALFAHIGITRAAELYVQREASQRTPKQYLL